jgi:hypothetical protein
MAYLGNTPTQQGFIPAIDFFSGNGSTTAFTLSRPVASVAQVQATIENVPQNPGDAFTVSGNTITFTSAPPSGTNNIYVYYTSPITQVVALPQSPQVFGNLQFSSSGARITGEMSTLTLADRLAFQTSVANGNTNVNLIPTGTAFACSLNLFGGSDINNAPRGQVIVNNATGFQISSNQTGTGTSLPMVFNTGGSETARFSATAKTLILAGGSTSANGTGITFPATQSASSNANTLDDYEEGEWLPTIAPATGAFGSVTYNANRTGYYTKIGRVVHIIALVSVGSYTTGTASGSMRIGSLPFPVADLSQNFAIGNISQYGGNGYTPSAATSNVALRLEQGLTYGLVIIDTNTAFTDESIGAFSTGGFLFRLTATYITST